MVRAPRIAVGAFSAKGKHAGQFVYEDGLPETVPLTCKDRYSRSFGSHSDTHDETNYKERLPRLGETRSDRCGDEDESSDEDTASSAKHAVQGVGEPASESSGSNVGSSIDHTNNPFVGQ